jgi:hypothetical protein
MPPKSNWDHEALEREQLRRYGLEHNPYEEIEQEIELGDRYAEQASLPPGSAAARAMACRDLGRAGSPYEQPHDRPAPTRMQPGEQVVRRAADGERERGRVISHLSHENLVVVAFEAGGETVVEASELERRAA